MKNMIRSLVYKVIPAGVLINVNATRKYLRCWRYIIWANSKQTDLRDFLEGMDPGLARESFLFAERLNAKATAELRNVPFRMGGGGAVPLLYFITKKFRPGIVVETGVASGFSSSAILAAMQDYDGGKLYSSDLPYPHEMSEDFVGILVDPELKASWQLCTLGDKECLPAICAQITKVDMFHYDSDKSFEGRSFAWGIIRSKLSTKGFIIWDDIQDNFHFRDMVTSLDCDYKVFAFGGKYIGLIRFGGD